MGVVYRLGICLMENVEVTVGITVVLLSVYVFLVRRRQCCNTTQKTTGNKDIIRRQSSTTTKASRRIRRLSTGAYPNRNDEDSADDEQETSQCGTEDDYLFSVPAEDLVPQVPFRPMTYSEDVMLKRSEDFYREVNTRRSCRFISNRKVPIEIIKNIILAAGTSPSGAHTEPWTYAVISNQDIKAEVRKAIEDEEELNYKRRMGDTWVYDVQSRLQTTWIKPYLEEAPFLIIVFKQTYGIGEDNEKVTHYYNEISTCISVGIMLTAIQRAGLVTVATTPLNAGTRLRQILGRPANEKVVLLLPVGYASEKATVPDLTRSSIDQIMKLYE